MSFHKIYFVKVIWFFLIFFLFSFYSQARVSGSSLPPKIIKFDHFTVDDGLSSPIVMDIIQDKQGFMWFTTTNGITRFDGYSFTNYLPNPYDPNDPATVGAAVVTGLKIDKKGLFWITTYGGGVDRYDVATDSFIHYRHSPKDPTSIGHNIIQSLSEDRKGNMWFATIGGGLNRYDRETDGFIRYRHDPDNPDSIGSDKTYNVHEDRKGILWVSVAHGIDRFDKKNNRFIHYRHDPNDSQSLPSSLRWTIAEDHLGTMWFGGADGGGLVRYDREKDHFIQYTFDPDDPDSISSNNIRNTLEDSKGTLWITTAGGGVNVYDRAKDRFISYQHDPNNPHSIAYNDIINVYEDRSGVLWFSTFGAGISKYDRKTERFRQMCQDPTDLNSLSHNDVHSIFQDSRDDLWIGTVKGLNKYSPQTGKFIHFRQHANNPNSLSSNFVKRVTEDAAGFIWIATLGQGINKFDPVKKTFTHYKKKTGNPNSLAENVCYTVFYNKKHNELWVGHQSQVSKYAISTNRFSHYGTMSFIESIFEDNTGKLWLSGGAGAFAYNREKDTLERIHRQPTPVTAGDKRGNIWMGTVSGLKMFDPITEESTLYSVADGLIANNVLGIIDDGVEGLWISTAKGLSHFDFKKKAFRNYSIAPFNRGGAFLKSTNGELFFGGPHGITRFYHSDIVDNSHIPPVVLTSFSKFNQKVKLETPVSNLSLLELSYQDRVFSFEFAALDYSDPKKNSYKYKLEGFDENWSEVASNRRIATYTNLDAGEYLFRVMASNNDGVWNQEGASIKIIITPPWWETVWFKALAGLLVLFIILSVFKYIVKLRFEIKERKNAEEAQRESELLLSSFTEALPDISFIYDEDGKYIKIFATCTDLLIADPEKMEGRNVRDVLPTDVANDFIRIIHDTIATNQPKVYDYELEVKTGNKWFQARTSPMKTEIKGKKAIVWIAFDITNRKKAEEKIRQLSQFQESIIDNANIWLNVLDENGNVLIWNKAAEKISGYSKEEVIGRSEIFLWSYPDEEYRNEINKKVISIMKGGEVKDLETIITCKDGSSKTMSWYSRNVLDDREKTIGSIALGIDISKRRQAEDEIKANLKEKETLLHEIHHRVKNNMQVINSLLKLQSNSIENDQIKEVLKDSQSRIYAMSAVHETLHGSVKLSEIDLKSYLSKITTAIFQTYSANPDKVKLNSKIEDAPINLNQAYPLGLIINELISNSLKYAFPEDRTGEITVELRKLDTELELIVMDDGIAIKRDFDWKNSSSLGLKLVRTLVENQLDGSINLDNTNGTKFTIKFNIET